MNMPEQIISIEKEMELLIDVSSDCIKEKQSIEVKDNEETNSNISTLITSPLLKEYNLDERDIRIISIVFNNLLNGRESVRATEILKSLEKNRGIAFWEIKRLSRLKENGIIEIPRYSDGDVDSIVSLLQCHFRLSGNFLERIYNEKEKTTIDTVEAYKDNYEYLSDQFEMIRILREGNNEFPRNHPRDRRPSSQRKILKQDDEVIKRLEELIAARLSKTDKVFPFEKFKRDRSLNRKEELIVITLLEREVSDNRDYGVDDLLNVMSKTPYEKLVDRKLFKKGGKLVKGKIIEISTQHSLFSGTMSRVKLNDNLKAKLLEDKKMRNRLNLKKDDFFEGIKPSVSIDKVILHPKTYEDISLAIGMIQGNTSRLLYEWGIRGVNLQKSESGNRRKLKQSVTILFYGAPGTGKTLTANAIAHKLKRRLLTFDCSKILGMWVGESEKNVRKIFDKYKEISKGMKNPPVLLLNEADQFLHRRINATRSVDNMYNQMQNIFLEQLERFEGVLIATTNLSENLDSAFSRRFHYKINFRRPGSDERYKLWQVHIPGKTPLSDDVDLLYLAEHYDLSGGQISVVVRNAAVRAAKRGDRLYQEDFIKACEEEIAGNFDEKAKIRVGF